MFESKIEDKGFLQFPEFTGLRIMMMPFLLEDADSLPDFMPQYRPTVARLVELSNVKAGVAYLTIDEAHVRAGETHRRPGLHVDGVGGAWGGGGGGYAANGMFVAATHFGCQGFAQSFDGYPGANGDCSHLARQCAGATPLLANKVYWCSPLAVHESVTLERDAARQFVRLSMPSSAPWHEGYTVNPKGVLPTGPIEPARACFMSFRP